MVSPYPIKNWEGEIFQKNAFHEGLSFAEKIYRGIVLHGGLMIRTYQGRNKLSSKLNNVNLKIFPNHGGIFT